MLFCLHCNGAVERGLAPSADGAAPARASNGISFGLHVSPRGVAKCVRSPSGRGASRPSPANGFFTKHEIRNTNHETRITAFYRVLRPSGGEKCRLGFWDHETRITAFTLFTKHETRNTNHGFSQPRPERKPPWSNGRTRCLGFVLGSRITNHETRITAFFKLRPSDARRRGEAPVDRECG